MRLEGLSGLVRGVAGNGARLFLAAGSLAVFSMAVGLSGGGSESVAAGAADSLSVSGASAVAFSFGSAALIPVIGLGSALALLVGNGMGAGDPLKARLAVSASARIALPYLACVILLSLVFPGFVVSLFSSDAEGSVLSPHAVYMLALAGAFVVFDGSSILLCSAVKGAGDTAYVMRMTGLVSGLQMIACCAAGFCGASPGVLWCLLVLGSCVKAAAAFLRYSSGAWAFNATAGSFFLGGSGP
jgi:MATE family multidrug resistance protein